jgi:hypothetical protein
MNVINIFIRFFMRVCKVIVQLLLNEGPYIIAIINTYVGVRKDCKG